MTILPPNYHLVHTISYLDYCHSFFIDLLPVKKCEFHVCGGALTAMSAIPKLLLTLYVTYQALFDLAHENPSVLASYHSAPLITPNCPEISKHTISFLTLVL